MSAIGELLRLNFSLPLAEKLQGTCASKWYKQIVKMQTWSPDEVYAWQMEHLHQFILHRFSSSSLFKKFIKN